MYIKFMHTNVADKKPLPFAACNALKVLVYDSLYSCVNAQTMKLVTTLYGTSCVEMGECPKQEGYTDCGIYAIAICVYTTS